MACSVRNGAEVCKNYGPKNSTPLRAGEEVQYNDEIVSGPLPRHFEESYGILVDAPPLRSRAVPTRSKRLYLRIRHLGRDAPLSCS